MVEVDFISFVPRGANRKKYFILKEDRELKEDILKAAAKLLKAYRDGLPEGAMQILAKTCGLPGPEPKEKIDAAAGQPLGGGRGRSQW